MSVAQDSRYAYAVGRIRVLENKLLDKAKFQRMLEARSADEAFRVLAETEYGELVAKAKNPHDFEVVTSGEIRRVYALIRQMLPKEPLTDLFCVKYDIHNLKVLLKAHYQGRDFDHLLIDAGLVPPDLMRYVVNGELIPGVPKRYYEVTEEAKAAYAASSDPVVIDTILDRALYHVLSSMAKEKGYPFYARIVTSQIDLANLRSLVRTKRLDRDRDFLQESLLPGGELPTDLFVELLSATWDEIVARFGSTRYRHVVDEGLRALQSDGQLTLFEKLIDDFIMEQVKQAKSISLGPEPLIGYISAKENEVRNIRIIMVGKLNDVPTEVIRERLRDSYV